MSIFARALLVLSTLGLLAPSPADAAERLGTFLGSDVSNMGGGVGHANADVKFRLSKERGRLYMNRVAEGPSTLKRWKQSFVVEKDVNLPDGTRVITYQRPADASRSGRFNVKQLNASRGEIGAKDVIDQLSGGGRLVIQNGKVSWNNVGTGLYHSAEHGVAFPLGWNEDFVGQSKVSLGKSAPAPIVP